MYPVESWQSEKIKKEDEVINFAWYRKNPLPVFVAEIELSKVVGTTHDSYNEGNWLAMLESLPKRSSDDDYVAMVRDNIDHSKSPLPTSQPITVRQYGEEYIIFWGGNHRICHAKFVGLRTIRVRVERCVIDPALVPPQRSDIPPLMPVLDARFTWLPRWARRRRSG